jgi:hypothetical protein
MPAGSRRLRAMISVDNRAGETTTTTETKSSGAASAPSRKLRLFGVNLDCGPEPEMPTAMYGYMHQQSPYPYAAVPNTGQ